MRRVRFYEYGEPDVLRVEETEVPEPGAGQVRIRVEAIGANFVDTLFRRGAGNMFQRPLPGELTGDVVGTVDAVGPGVVATAVGDRVAALADPAFADSVLADVQWLAPVPDGVDTAMASMLPMAAPVALRVLRTGKFGPGETVLVHAAAGGIGHLAVQLAKLGGAGTVIATAGSAAKLDFARAYGADVAIDYTDDDWAEQVRAAAPGGVDVILDSVGGEVTRRGFDLLAPYGRLVMYGATSGEPVNVPFRQLAGLKYVVGFTLFAWRLARPEQARAEITEIADHVRAGRLRTAPHTTFPLTETAEVHRLIESRTHLGRILVTP